ncbi:MAG TPA: SURF1 family protein [Caulobacteraceae bacterium]|nr:SURF1 family protein [Caulobacteraceae bacterium]
MDEAPRRFPVGLTIATAVAFAILIGLGVWQVKRLAWKTDMLARIEALQKAPARPLAEVLAQHGDLEFQRVAVNCAGLGQAKFGAIYAIQDGDIADRIVSACRLEGPMYDGIVVDRGLILDSAVGRLPVRDGGPPVHVVGVLRHGDHKPPRRTEQVGASAAVSGNNGAPPAPNRPPLWFGRYLPTVASYLGLERPAPYFLMAETSTNPDVPQLKPAAVPTDIPNNHLSYAITWFGLAAALVGVYAALLRRTLKGR